MCPLGAVRALARLKTYSLETMENVSCLIIQSIDVALISKLDSLKIPGNEK